MAEVTPEQAQQVIQQVQATGQPPAAQPIRIETSTGAVFEGATEQEVLQKLVQSVEHGSNHIRNLSQQVETLQQQVNQVQQPAPTTGQKTPQDLYWEKWQKDPIEADRYAASVRLGVPPEHVDQIERQTVMNSAVTARNTALSEFYDRCPDYPKDDQYAAEAMRVHLQRSYPNQPITADTLELAYNALARSGTVMPLDIPLEGYAEEPQTMPRVGSGQQLAPQDFERQFRQLNPDQMRQAIEELRARGAR